MTDSPTPAAQPEDTGSTRAENTGATHAEVLKALTGIIAGFFVSMLSINVVVTALPRIVETLDGSQAQYSWTLTGTLLANAASTPIWGKLADLMDKKRLFLWSLVIFMVGSLVAGAAPSMEVVIGGRVVQGTGVGGMVAVGMAIMGTITTPRERGRYNGYIGAAMASATAAGPLLGGLIVDTLGWRWTFWIALPLSLAAMVVVWRNLHVPYERRTARIDWLGALFLAVSSGLFLMLLSFAGNPLYFPWLSWQSALLAGGSVLFLVLFVWVESVVPEPVMSLRIFRNRTAVLCIVASASIAVLMMSLPAFLTLYLQSGRGLTPTEAGLQTLPLIIANFVASTTAGQLISRYGRWKVFLVVGSLLGTLGTAWLGLASPDTPLWLISVKLGVIGLGVGMTVQNLMLAVQNSVPVTQIGTTTGAVTFFRTIGGAVGNSLMSAVMSLQLVAATAAGAAADPAQAYAEGGPMMFTVAAILSAPCLLAVLFIREIPLRRTV